MPVAMAVATTKPTIRPATNVDEQRIVMSLSRRLCGRTTMARTTVVITLVGVVAGARARGVWADEVVRTRRKPGKKWQGRARLRAVWRTTRCGENTQIIPGAGRVIDRISRTR